MKMKMKTLPKKWENVNIGKWVEIEKALSPITSDMGMILTNRL